MNRIKGIALIVVLITALTGAVYGITQKAPDVSTASIDNDHARMHDILREKLSNAEFSISALSNDLASDTTLVQELASVREKLLISTPDDLKKNTSNKWNIDVFNALTEWKDKKDAASKNRSSADKGAAGNMNLTQPILGWWGKAPDLVLAFASVPMKDGSIASLHIAEGIKGKEFTAGKRYDESYPILASVIQNNQPQFGHFIWKDSMYMASVTPVNSGDQQVGMVVVGYELSKDSLANFSKAMPKAVDLGFVYATPKFGDQTDPANAKRMIYSALDFNTPEKRQNLNKAQFHSNSPNSPNATSVAFDQIPANTVYVGSIDDTNIAMSRLRWVWNENEETDLYVISNLMDTDNTSNRGLFILITGLLAMLVGSILIVLLLNSMIRNMHRIKRAVADAITSGEPVDAGAIALLLGGSEDDFPQYTVKQTEVSEEDRNESWTNMMMDFEDEANEKADAALPAEEKARLKADADIEEAKPLYEEYMRLRKENHIDTPMEFDSFVRKLQRNAAKIKAISPKTDNDEAQIHSDPPRVPVNS
ncbi:MAG: hypothetical protein J6A01_11340, partial [Proteobacteria bacterium]|nr:hypothetical protein [Pseudomonadota bacterium]